MNTFKEITELYPFYQLVLTALLILGYFILKKTLSQVVIKRALAQNFDELRQVYIKKAILVILKIAFVIVTGLIWDLSFKGLSVYVASVFTVVGVGLFATWSIVSNITASFILFFFFPIKIGSKVKIVDGDNSVEGVIISVSLFSIKVQNKDGMDVYYPNNLAIQKSIIHIVDKEVLSED